MKKRLDEFKTKMEAIDYIVSEKKCTRAQAEKYLMKEIPKESYYQTKIIKYLRANYPQALIWKAAAGAYSYCGIPDICMVYGGRYFGLEVKRPFVGKISPIQLQTIRKIREAGGIAGIVTSIEEVKELIQEGLL